MKAFETRPARNHTFLEPAGEWRKFTGREQGGDLQSASASHLNGRMGLILRTDPGGSTERRRVQVADGVEVRAGGEGGGLQYYHFIHCDACRHLRPNPPERSFTFFT